MHFKCSLQNWSLNFIYLTVIFRNKNVQRVDANGQVSKQVPQTADIHNAHGCTQKLGQISKIWPDRI